MAGKSAKESGKELKELMIGISPCPNDTFIFHALLHGLVKLGYTGITDIRHGLWDVQKLNEKAVAGELPVTKLSVGVLPAVLDKYIVLSSGAALGWGCGPLVVAKDKDVDISKARVAIPGRHTTAAMLLNMHGGFGGERVEMLFSDIMPAIARGDADVGVIIHEGRFTYGRHGLVKLLDLGQWWEGEYNMPLPLGAIACRRDLDRDLIKAVEAAIKASLEYARANPAASGPFIRQNAQELADDVVAAHIETFVTDYSLDLGKQGRDAISWLVKSAFGRSGKNTDIEIFIK